MERAEAVAKLRAGIQLEGRNIHERYNIVEAIRLLMVKLLEELDGESDDILNGFVEDERVKELDKVANLLIERGMELIRDSEYNDGKVRIAGYIKEAYQVLGRREFEKFLIAIEWNYPKDMKFYDIRENVLRDWVRDLEDLEYGRLKILSISAPPRTGKALSLDSKILTPTGWKEMKDIKEGDYVISADGKKAEVLGVFPQGKKEMYRVTFDDKTSVKCSGDHLWEVRSNSDRQAYKGRRKSRILKTIDIKDDLILKTGESKYSIDYVEPIEFENQLIEDDLHPYLLGSLLSNGHIGRDMVAYYTPYKDILEKISNILPETDRLNIKRYNNVYKCSVGKKNIGREKNTCLKKLIEYRLDGKTAKDKFIPKKYLYSSIENRLELLKGLMDGDGSSSNGQIRYTTISEQLAKDIMELIRSLGGRVTCNRHENYKNDKRVKDRYDLQISLKTNPFYCEYKSKNWKKPLKYNYKKIKEIEKIEDEECQCIYVNHPSHLFVTDGYNLTHNTTIGERFFLWCMLRHPQKSCFFVSHTRSNGNKSI